MALCCAQWPITCEVTRRCGGSLQAPSSSETLLRSKMVKWRKRERLCGPWAVAIGARTVSVGVSRIGRGILHALDAVVLLTELVVRCV